MILSKSSTFKYLFQYLKFIESFYKPLLYGPRAILGGSALGHFYVTEILWPPPRVQILARQILETVLCRKKFCIYVARAQLDVILGGGSTPFIIFEKWKLWPVGFRQKWWTENRERRTQDELVVFSPPAFFTPRSSDFVFGNMQIIPSSFRFGEVPLDLFRRTSS